MIVYQNKNYRVETNEDGLGYSLINNITNAVERKEGLLPIALGMALDLDSEVERITQELQEKASVIDVPSQGILLPH